MSATNLTALLVVCLAVLTVIFLLRKRFDSNLPLLFYFVAITFTNAVDRPVNPFVMYGGLVLALLLRFEFMGRGFTKFIAFCATSALAVIIWIMVSDVFST
jgi:hypothetical protein